MNHGGKRKGAGRKAKRHADGSRVEPSHQRRPRFTKSRPLHVTLEVNEEVPNLRAANMAPVVCDAIGRANRRVDFRVVHICLLGRHVHLICEADGPEALASGMKSLNGTIAKAVNTRLGRKGRVIASRFHLHVLRTKTEVRNAVQYVLRNADRHGLHEAWPGGVGGPGNGTAALGMPRADPLSTAAWFPSRRSRTLLLWSPWLCVLPLLGLPRQQEDTEAQRPEGDQRRENARVRARLTEVRCQAPFFGISRSQVGSRIVLLGSTAARTWLRGFSGRRAAAGWSPVGRISPSVAPLRPCSAA
jgi:putative transposase